MKDKGGNRCVVCTELTAEIYSCSGLALVPNLMLKSSQFILLWTPRFKLSKQLWTRIARTQYT